MSTLTLTDELWQVLEPVHERILEHPFLRGLTDGTLDRDAFRYYVVQDAHYLRDYARALSICAARAPAERELLMFARHAAVAIEVERELHEGFFADFGLSEEDVAATPVAPTCRAYTSYLLGVASLGSFPEALAAVLPCYWIYWEVGKSLAGQGSPDALYRRWIDTYAGEDFAAVVAEVLALTDRVAGDVSASGRARMREHAAVTARYEWMFWDAAWRQERWPV